MLFVMLWVLPCSAFVAGASCFVSGDISEMVMYRRYFERELTEKHRMITGGKKRGVV